MMLSVVATLYRSEATVDEFHRRASAAARSAAADAYEIVLVNDGSPDASLDRALGLAGDDRHLVVVDLSRNFGHHKAMMTGLAHAHGERVFLVDSDLEEDPAWLLPFAAALDDHACDVVYGIQTRRKGGWLERWSGAAYYRLMAGISDVPLPANMVTARLMTRRYVDALLRHEERELDIGGLWALTGFAQRAYPVVKLSSSPTTYTFGRRLALLIDSVTSLSTAPLMAIFYSGVVAFALACAIAVALALRWLADGSIDRWSSLVATLWLMGSLLFTFIGILGIYVAKIHSEVKRRPYTIVRGVHGRDAG